MVVYKVCFGEELRGYLVEVKAVGRGWKKDFPPNLGIPRLGTYPLNFH